MWTLKAAVVVKEGQGGWREAGESAQRQISQGGWGQASQRWDRSSVVAGSQLEEEESGTGQIKFQCLSQQTMVQ